jgi:hypothetical protein
MSTDRSSFHHRYSALALADLTEDENYKLAVLLNKLTEDIKKGSTFTDKEIGKLTKSAFENSTFENKEKLQNVLDNFLQQLDVKFTYEDDNDGHLDEEASEPVGSKEETGRPKEETGRPKDPDSESFMDVLRVVASEEPAGVLKQAMDADSDLSVKCCCITIAKFKK